VNAVGTEGMGYYNVAYPIYALLVVVSTAGLPTAISKLVSERAAIGDYAGAHATFRAAFRVLVLAGVITSLVMFAASGFIAGSIVMQSVHPVRSFLSSLFIFKKGQKKHPRMGV
jgi:stage V sporulation protein B